jgi:predicted N-acyltransferase
VSSAPVWQFYEFYQTTTDKHWGRQYLTREFFHRIGADMGSEVLLVVAREGAATSAPASSATADTVAGALNLIGR